MQFNIDIGMVLVWLAIVFTIFPTLFGSLWAIWRSGDDFRKKLDHSVPIVWNAVQQIIRKAEGSLPAGKKPIDLALELLKKFVKLTPKQEEAARIAFQAYHESQGAPKAVHGVTDMGSALSENVAKKG